MNRVVLIAGLLALLLGSVGVAMVVGGGGGNGSSKGSGSSTSKASTSIACVGGSEKQELMADPKVTSLLRSKYGLSVDFQPMGSYEQVQLTTAQIKAKQLDCLWPSSASAQLVFESLHPTGDFATYQAATVLQSPEVIYAGPEGTKVLTKQKVVVERANRFFIVDMKRLLSDFILKQKTWGSLGAQNIAGPVAISSTDPAKSNSGFTLYQLMLTIVSTDNAYKAPTMAQARVGLPTVHDLYEAQGLQAKSSDSGFEQWLLQGAELHAPLYAGYENQLLQKVVENRANPDVQQQLKESVRVLYPEPTIYADHPILALDANARKFLAAMKDPEIQRLAWKRYGFRSGVQIGLNPISDFSQVALAASLRTTSPPSAAVTLALLQCVQHNNCSFR